MLAAYTYCGVARSLGTALKYRGRRSAARLLAEGLCRAHRLPAIDGVVPVPLHRRRQLARGYNQSQLLARVLAEHLGVPVVEALRRVRRTRSQTQLAAPARWGNVRGAFAARRSRRQSCHGRRWLLVDDVVTTGATLAECVATLHRAGARGVVAACPLWAERPGSESS